MAKVTGRFVADAAGLARALTGPQGAGVRLAARAARQIESQAKTNAPVATGILRNSIAADPAPKVAGLVVQTGVEASANYALPVHQGVKGGGIIRPKNGQALKFQIGGRTVFAKSVRQGAQRPRPFLYNAAEQVGSRLGFTTSRVP